MITLARKPERDEERSRVEAVFLRLNPDLDHESLAEMLRWIKNTAHDSRNIIKALNPEVDAINRMLDQLQLALDAFASPIVKRRWWFTPGRDAWFIARQALFPAGVRLPEDPTESAKALRSFPRPTHARPNSRRGRGRIKHAVANVCAGLYHGLTGKLPPVDFVDGDWGELVSAVFDWLDLGPAKKIAQAAAQELTNRLDPRSGKNRPS
jgi:hypothetical protein